jgi:hypothetical protein
VDAPEKRAVNLAILALTDYRKRNYAAGHAAYTIQGIRAEFATNAEKEYQKYTRAIEHFQAKLKEEEK